MLNEHFPILKNEFKFRIQMVFRFNSLMQSNLIHSPFSRYVNSDLDTSLSTIHGHARLIYPQHRSTELIDPLIIQSTLIIFAHITYTLCVFLGVLSFTVALLRVCSVVKYPWLLYILFCL
jgi:hypothetical protein